ncbi:MAG: segregation/condensation protein A [Candidatus Wolfebacteria bacterium]|nr:segregation/condensation protein A [Candidatus Wolfebacteria bacterium]
MDYLLKTEQFSGPMDKLLELIEARKMEVTELNLAGVTADFLSYLESIESAPPRLLADFVVIASKLLLIKSKALLPNLELSPEDEKDISDLEGQLKFYQAFKPAMGHMKKLWGSGGFSVSRPLMAGRPIVFYPSEAVTLENLSKAIRGIFEELAKFAMETKTIKSPLVSLEEKIQELIGFMEKSAANPGVSASLNFQELKKNRSRPEIIVMFLAVLHLLQRQIVKAEQKGEFSDIMIEKA